MKQQSLKRILIGDLSWRRLLRTLVFVYVCLVIFALVGSDQVIFQPQPSSYRDTPEIIKLESGHGRTISARYLVHPDAEYTVLYSHGNAEDLGDLRDFLQEYRDLGFSVLAYDYSGYGTSTGAASTPRACEDAEAALGFLRQHEKVPLDRIILHGRSVGGGPALYLAEKYQVGGLVVESAFVTAFRVITRVPLVPFDKFRNISRIGRVNCPVLVIHGREDDVVPFWHGEALYRRAREPKRSCWLDGTTHNYMPEDARTVAWAEIAAFAGSLHSTAAPHPLPTESGTVLGDSAQAAASGRSNQDRTLRSEDLEERP